MMKIMSKARVVVSEDCGNAPKKQFIKDFLITLAHGDIKTSMGMVTEDVQLHIPNHPTANGSDAFGQLLASGMLQKDVAELEIDNIISHGDRCAANGTVQFGDGDRVAFCAVFIFNNFSKSARIKEITVYPIVLRGRV